jgi:hypothetical protein
MGEQRFENLREALLRTGVAGRQLRRALVEIEAHFRHLLDEERAHGQSDQEARIAAHKRLGTNETLVLSYAARPELRAWSRRWPAVWFVILPLISYIVISAATLAGILIIADQMTAYLHTVHLAPQITDCIDFAARVVLLWIFPMSVFATVAVFAYRRRVALRWPLSGIVVTSLFASLINVTLRFTGGPELGEIGGGIGISPQTLPAQLMRAALLTSFAVMPLWIAVRRGRSSYHAI